MATPHELDPNQTALLGLEHVVFNKAVYAVEPTGRDIYPAATHLMIDLLRVTDAMSLDAEDTESLPECDFATITIPPGKATPIQMVNREGAIDAPLHGHLAIIVLHSNGQLEKHIFNEFNPQHRGMRVEYEVGDIIRCIAFGSRGGMFIEQCTPPYSEGFFTNLEDDDAVIPEGFTRAVDQVLQYGKRKKKRIGPKGLA